MRNYVSLLPQFLQYLASVGFNVPHDTQEAEVSNAPHLMQCFAPAMSWALHLEHLPIFGDSSGGLGGASALGENTSDRITTSPTVAIFSCPSSNSPDDHSVRIYYLEAVESLYPGMRVFDECWFGWAVDVFLAGVAVPSFLV